MTTAYVVAGAAAALVSAALAWRRLATRRTGQHHMTRETRARTGRTWPTRKRKGPRR